MGLIILALTAFEAKADEFSPAAVTVSSEYAADARLGVMMINGSGLDANLQLHGTTASLAMWLSSGSDSPVGQQATFDLGANYNLNGMHVWNYNESGGTARGIQQVRVEVANTAGGTYTIVGTNALTQAPGTDGYAGENYTLSQANVRMVRFTILTNWGDASYVGLSEVRFAGLIVNPNLIVPAGVTVTSEFYGRPGASIINRSGLIANQHSVVPTGNMWLSSGSGSPVGQQATFDLGANYNLNGMHVWNYNEAEAGLMTRGISNVVVEVASAVGGPYRVVGTNTFGMASGLATYTGDDYGLSATNVRVVRFTVLSTHGDSSYVGLSEVEFFRLDPYQVVPAGVTVTSEFYGRPGASIINRSGLIANQHSVVPTGNMWLSSGSGSPVGQQATFDLGANYNLNGMHVWNYNENNFTSRGVSNVVVEVASAVGGPYTVVGTNTFVRATGMNNYTGDDYSLSATNVRVVRFTVLSTHGDSSYVGLSEVEFSHSFTNLVVPVGVIVSSELTTFDRYGTYMISGAGLTDYAHGVMPGGTMWESDGSGFPQTATFDLGANYNLDGMLVWNYNENNFTSRGVSNVVVEVASALGGPYTVVGTNTFVQATGLTNYTGDRYSLTATNVRAVRFTIQNNYNTSDAYVGLSEVRFLGGNTPPVANPDSLTWGKGTSNKNISIANLLANDTSSSGYTLSLIAVDAASANGVTLTTNATDIQYTAALTHNDSFNYTISDGHGGTASALVSITPTNSYAQSGEIIATLTNVTAKFYGIPYTNYYVMRATNVNFTAGISNFPSGPAAANGVIQVVDDFADIAPPVPASAFYRLIAP